MPRPRPSSSSDSSPEEHKRIKSSGTMDRMQIEAILDAKFEKFLKMTSARMEELHAESDKRINDRHTQSEIVIQELIEAKLNAYESRITELEQKNQDLNRKVEMLERNQKRKGVIIDKLKAKKEEVAIIVAGAMKEAGVVPVKLRDIREINLPNGQVKFVGECETFEDKMQLMKIKKKLRYNHEAFYVNHDYTKNERDIQFKARRFAEKNPGTTGVGYKTVYVNGKEYKFNEEADTFLPTNLGQKANKK